MDIDPKNLLTARDFTLAAAQQRMPPASNPADDDHLVAQDALRLLGQTPPAATEEAGAEIAQPDAQPLAALLGSSALAGILASPSPVSAGNVQHSAAEGYPLSASGVGQSATGVGGGETSEVYPLADSALPPSTGLQHSAMPQAGVPQPDLAPPVPSSPLAMPAAPQWLPTALGNVPSPGLLAPSASAGSPSAAVAADAIQPPPPLDFESGDFQELLNQLLGISTGDPLQPERSDSQESSELGSASTSARTSGDAATSDTTSPAGSLEIYLIDRDQIVESATSKAVGLAQSAAQGVIGQRMSQQLTIDSGRLAARAAIFG